MATREELQAALEETLGTRNVYFSPPSNMSLEYPCIVYKRQPGLVERANNAAYFERKRYQLTVIDSDPDSLLVDTILRDFAYADHRSRFVKENLTHDVIDLFY